MKLAIYNWTRRRTGGAEVYLASILPELSARGAQIGFWHEWDRPADRDPIPLPPDSPRWCGELGIAEALSGLRAWRPDVIYAHGSQRPDWERSVSRVAPTVYFIHNYYGTCISGAKAHKFPRAQPCAQPFGWRCLASYYPRHCGGWHPLTAWRLYRDQAARLRNLRACALLLMHSVHMRAEYLRLGFDPNQLQTIPYCVSTPARMEPHRGCPELPSRLLFLGRMDPLKGGALLLEALPEVQRQLGRPLTLTMVGDGPARGDWEQRAAQLMSRHPSCQVRFTGWVEAARVGDYYASSDLLVVPSVWPEPFGQVGLEAGHYALPAAAFQVGGISAWLQDGLNGHLAPGQSPDPAGLAAAIVRCLADPAHYESLARAAQAQAAQMSVRAHVDRLWPLLQSVARAAAPDSHQQNVGAHA